MRTQRSTINLAVIVALTLLAGACGFVGNSADQELVDAITIAFDAEQEAADDFDQFGEPTTELNNCMAESIVEGLGGAAAMEANFGITIANANQEAFEARVEVPKDEAGMVADAMLACGLADEFVRLAAAGDDSVAPCVVEQLDFDALRDSMASTFMFEAEAAEVYEASQQALVASLFTANQLCEIDA